jgi:hypothetical protein
MTENITDLVFNSLLHVRASRFTTRFTAAKRWRIDSGPHAMQHADGLRDLRDRSPRMTR